MKNREYVNTANTEINKAFNAILADAFSKTSMQDGRIDMSALIKNFCGNYTVDGKKVTKNAPKPITEEPGTDRE